MNLREIIVLLVMDIYFVSTDFLWPEAFESADKKLHIISVEWKLPVRIGGFTCGTKDLPIESQTVYQAKLDHNVFNTTINTIDVSVCTSRTEKIVRAEGYRREVHYKLHAGPDVSTNLIPGKVIHIPICPEDHHAIHSLIPCFYTGANSKHCDTIMLCNDRLVDAQPHVSIDTGNSSMYMYKRESCHVIPALHKDVKCSATKLQADSPSVPHEIWCKIKKIQVRNGKIDISIPYKSGGQVCLNYHEGNQLFQRCKLSRDSIAEFTIPTGSKNLIMTCGGLKQIIFKHETKDLQCPGISLAPDLAVKVCSTTYRPEFFWVSLVWMFSGLPLSWALVALAYHVKYKRHFKHFAIPKTESFCKVCRGRLYSVIDKKSHEESCPENKCPHCERRFDELPDLRNHMITCEMKKETVRKLEEVLQEEHMLVSEKYNSHRAYNTVKFKAIWFAVYLLIFLCCFIPIGAGHPHRHNKKEFGQLTCTDVVLSTEKFITSLNHGIDLLGSCSVLRGWTIHEGFLIFRHQTGGLHPNRLHKMRDISRRLIIDSSLKPARDPPSNSGTDDKDYEIDVDTADSDVFAYETVDPDVLRAMAELLGFSTAEVLQSVNNSTLDISTQLENLQLGLIAGRQQLQDNFDVMRDQVLEKLTCPKTPELQPCAPCPLPPLPPANPSFTHRQDPPRGFSTNIRCENMFTYVTMPKSFQGDLRIRVHIDDVSAFNTMLNSFEHSTGPKAEHRGITAGEDAVVQTGRDYQLSIGGSGSNKKTSSDGSISSDVIGDPEGKTKRIDYRSIFNNAKSAEMDRLQNPRRIGLKPRNRRNVGSNDVELDALKVEAAQHMLNDDAEIAALNNVTVDHSKDFSLPMNDEWAHLEPGEAIFNFGEVNPVIRKTRSVAAVDSRNAWFDFGSRNKDVCNNDCLHVSGTCTCLTSTLPANGIITMPWATQAIKDIRLYNNPNMFVKEGVTLDVADDKTGKIKTNIQATLDLYEGSHLTFELQHENLATNPMITFTIPKITQIYSTKFLYYTCEREIDVEVKGLCTGSCGDYCGGKTCLGTQIWKWQGCRKWTCNPSWCWAVADGCCCCGANVICPNDKLIGSMWEVEYERTEILLCVILNDRVQDCRTVSGTAELKFGEITIGVSRVLDPSKKSPKHVFFTVKQFHIGSDGVSGTYTTDITDAYLDPDACTSGAYCNHGYIGDVQATSLKCLKYIGRKCYRDASDLKKHQCASEVFVTFNQAKMRKECHSGDHHSCVFDDSKKSLLFQPILDRAVKLSRDFNVNKLKLDVNRKSLLYYIYPKSPAGTITMSVDIHGLAVATKEVAPIIEKFTISDCKGCYSCSSGMECLVTVEQHTADNVLFTVSSDTPEITVSKAPIMSNKGLTNTKIFATAYSDVSEFKACLSYGAQCLKKASSIAVLHEPVGNFYPITDSITTYGTEGPPPQCSGLKWFKCAASSVVGFFGSIWNWFKNAWWILIVAALVVLTIMFFPYIMAVLKVVYVKLHPKSKAFKKYQGKSLNDVYKALSYKIFKKKKSTHKEKSDQPSESVRLFIEEEPTDEDDEFVET